MARFTNRRSCKTLPREYARAGFINDMFGADGSETSRGGGGAGGQSASVLRSERRELRGVVVCGRITQRMMVVLGSDGRDFHVA